MRRSSARSSVNDGIDSLFFGTAERSYSPLSSRRAAGLLRRDALRDRPRRREHACSTRPAGPSATATAPRMKDGARLTLRFPVSTNQSIPAEQSLFEQVQATAKEAGFDVVISAARPVELVRRTLRERVRDRERAVHEGRARRAADPVPLRQHHARAQRVLREPRAARRPRGRRAPHRAPRRRATRPSAPRSTSRRSS